MSPCAGILDRYPFSKRRSRSRSSSPACMRSCAHSRPLTGRPHPRANPDFRRWCFSDALRCSNCSVRCFAFRNSRVTTRRANQFHIFHLQTVEPSCEKYTAWSFASISFINGVVPARMRGVSRSSRTSVSECGGRGSVGRESGDDRADLDGLVSQPARRRTALIAYGKAVWSWHPLLVSSSRR